MSFKKNSWHTLLLIANWWMVNNESRQTHPCSGEVTNMFLRGFVRFESLLWSMQMPSGASWKFQKGDERGAHANCF